MAIIGIWGQPGCPHNELARLIADEWNVELVTETALQQWMVAEGSREGTHRRWLDTAKFVFERFAGDHAHVVACFAGVEAVIRELDGALRVFVIAAESVRVKQLIVAGLSRMQAKSRLRSIASAEAEIRKRRFGQKTAALTWFDFVLNTEHMDLPTMADLLLAAAERGSSRSKLAERTDCRVPARTVFGHPSEQAFADLLDFCGISWQYEPKSFPLEWDKDGEVSEAFTPDFYLPDYDLYIELTTMKQANVTKKNRKIRRLRAIYPHVNIEIFYKKDVQEFVLKRRLPDRLWP